jgi:hypothetical protein
VHVLRIGSPPEAIPFSLIVAAFISPPIATNTGSPIPDLSGQWRRDMAFFDPFPSGPGPVIRAERKADGSVVVQGPCIDAQETSLGVEYDPPV